MNDQKPEIRQAIADSKDLSDDTIQLVEAALKEFNAQHDFIPVVDDAIIA
jgi:ribonuclease HIII